MRLTKSLTHGSPRPWTYFPPVFAGGPDWIEDAGGNVVLENVGAPDGAMICDAVNRTIKTDLFEAAALDLVRKIGETGISKLDSCREELEALCDASVGIPAQAAAESHAVEQRVAS